MDFATLIRDAAKAAGTSEAAIVLQVLRRRLGTQRMPPADFFKLGLYRPELSTADRDAFVAETTIFRLNALLSPTGERSLAGLVDSKILSGLLLRGAGLPTSETVAVARATPAPLPFPVLTGAAAVEAFLRDDTTLPIFGKPDDSLQGIGAASFVGLEGDTVVLGDGSRANVAALATEIARDYPQGYLFQKILRPHPNLLRLIGPVVGSLRVATLRQKSGPEVLFAMLKMPGPGAMVDGGVSGANGAAMIDPASGRILRAQHLSRPAGQDLLENHVTGASLVGETLPDFAQAIRLALDAHRLFPAQGVLGTDIIPSDRGPVINEINSGFGTTLYQAASARGLMDEGVKARYREALALYGVSRPKRGLGL
jgi:hypothetical protein